MFIIIILKNLVKEYIYPRDEVSLNHHKNLY